MKWFSFLITNKWRAGVFLLFVFLLLMAGSVSFFHKLRPELEYLLPQNHELIQNLKEFNSRFPLSDNTLIALECTKECDQVSNELSHMLKEKTFPNTALVKNNFKDELVFFEKYSSYYYPINQYKTLDEKIFERKGKKTQNPDSFQTALINFIQYKRLGIFQQISLLPSGMLVSRDGKSALIFIIHKHPFINLSEAEIFTKQLDGLVKELKLSDKRLQAVKFNGFAHSLVNEYKSLWGDMILSSVLVIILLVGLLYYFFRSWRIVIAIFIPLFFGISGLYTFGALFFSNINSNAFFLSSLIAGNSINVGIILMANSKLYKNQEDVHLFDSVFRASFKPTFLSTVSTSIAYGVLCFLPFKGFSDFGVLGFFGMLFCFMSYYLLFPLLYNLNIFNASDLEKSSEHNLNFKFKLKVPALAIVSLFFIMLIGLAAGGAFKRENLFEPDMNKIKDRSYTNSSFESFKGKISSISVNSSLFPTGVILLDNASDAFRFKGVLDNDPVIRKLIPEFSVFSWNDIIPSDINQKQFYLDRLRSIKDVNFIKQFPSITAEEEKLLDLAYGSTAQAREMDNEAPPFLKMVFSEKEKLPGNILYLSFNLNKLETDLFRMNSFFNRIDLLKKTINTPGSVLYVGIIPMLSTIGEMIMNFWWKPVVTSVGMILILIMAFSSKGINRPKFLLAYLFIVAAFFSFIFIFNIKLQVLNYISVILTLGIGIDYLINLTMSKNRSKISAFILLCSLTTMLSYLALYLGTTHLGLRSFALLALIGEVVAIIVSFLMVSYISD